MTTYVILGLVLVIVAGLLQGTGIWPFKVTNDICLEKFLLFNVGTAFILIPGIIVFFFLDFSAILNSINKEMLWRSLLFSAGWGIANVLYLICVMKIGAALTGVFLFSLGTSVGMIMPMVLKGSGIFEKAPDLMTVPGMLILASIIVIIFGVFLLTLAGLGRERVLADKTEEERKKQASGHFIEGLILVCIAGVLSAGLSLSFIYIQDDILKEAQSQGVSKIMVTPVVWSIGAFGGIVVNILFAFILLIKNGTWKTLFARKEEPLYAFLSGFQWFLSMMVEGLGMVYLGPLGATVGAGIRQGVSLLSNQLVGFIGGEWKGVHGRPRLLMYWGVVIILLAIVIMSVSNQLVS